ncbi:hypothetical protein SDC9_55572 [bioreactor metagenome]|uniref:Uncharacterized protein n=1 Tax=bioreactor metagenome TaxID=1076179 RepID=A0A644WZB0_9ZZZZ
MILLHQLDESQGEDREIADDHDGDDLRHEESENLPGDVLEAHIVILHQGHGNEEVHRHGRRDHAHGGVHHHDDAQHQRVHADGRRDGKEQGRHEENDGLGLEKHAEEKEDQVDQGDQDKGVGGDGDDPGGDLRRHPADGDEPRHGLGRGDDEKDHRCADPRLDDHRPDGLQVQFPVDEGADQEAVDDSHGAGLGGGENSSVDAAEDDEGHDDGQDGIFHGGEKLPAGAGFLPGDVEPGGLDDHHQAEHHGQQDAGAEAREEEVADGDPGHHSEGDHGNGRRDDHAEGASRRRDGGGEGGRVALLDHGGNHDAADGGHRGRVRSADGPEECAREDGDESEPSPVAPDQGGGQFDQAAGNAPVLHEAAGQHEEGNGHEGKGVGGCEHALGHHDGVEGEVPEGYPRDGGEADAHRNGDVQEDEEYEDGKHDRCHAISPPSCERRTGWKPSSHGRPEKPGGPRETSRGEQPNREPTWGCKGREWSGPWKSGGR